TSRVRRTLLRARRGYAQARSNDQSTRVRLLSPPDDHSDKSPVLSLQLWVRPPFYLIAPIDRRAFAFRSFFAPFLLRHQLTAGTIIVGFGVNAGSRGTAFVFLALRC